MNKLLLMIIAIMFHSFLSVSRGQNVNESPYAVFGDDTPVLDVNYDIDIPRWRVLVHLPDSTLAEIKMSGDTLIVFSQSGNILAKHRINSTTYALFTSMDPKAEETPWVSPYVYCFGNPMKYVDLDGLKPTEYEGALMCLVAYKDGDDDYRNAVKILNEKGWKNSSKGKNLPLNHPVETGIGLQSLVFEKKKEDGKMEYAYVFAGTNSIEDGVEDLTQLFGFAPQYGDAINNAKRLNEDLEGSELTFVGHSMGGAEAAAASMATGRLAMAYNPAVISPLTKFFYGLSGDGNVINYISGTPEMLGGSSPTDMVTFIQNMVGMHAPGSNILVPVGWSPTHSIKKLIEALKPNEP